MPDPRPRIKASSSYRVSLKSREGVMRKDAGSGWVGGRALGLAAAVALRRAPHTQGRAAQWCLGHVEFCSLIAPLPAPLPAPRPPTAPTAGVRHLVFPEGNRRDWDELTDVSLFL